MVNVFIDESGDLGRGGKYFVLAAAVFNTTEGSRRAARRIRQERLRLSPTDRPLSEIKSHRLDFVNRQRILNYLVSKEDLDIFYFVADKTHVTLLRTDERKNLVYNYFAWLLIEKIIMKYNDNFNIIFDNRTTSVKSMKSLPDYIVTRSFDLTNRIGHTISVDQRDSRHVHNLQVADLLANTIYQSYRYQRPHFYNLIKSHIISADEFPKNSFSGTLRYP